MTPGSAVRLASVARHVTDCATRPATTGYARALKLMFIWRELGGTGTGYIFQFTYCVYVHSSFAIILMGKRPLLALLSLSSWCHVCLHFVIVVFPDHAHLLFTKNPYIL